jgi:hypothetical protein
MEFPAELTAESLATNEFLDPTLRLPAEATPYYSTCPRGESR